MSVFVVTDVADEKVANIFHRKSIHKVQEKAKQRE